MSKQTKMLVITLSILGVLLLYNFFFFAKKKKAMRPKSKPQASKTDSSRAAAVAAAAANIEVPEVRMISFPSMQSDWGRDPFLLPIEAEKGQPYEQIKPVVVDDEPDDVPRVELHHQALAELNLNGILFDARKPMAIVNQSLHRRGARLAEIFTLQDIKRDRIVLVADGHEYEISLNSPALKEN